MSKFMMVAAFVTGYVLGARAGRERYEQIMSFVEQLQGRADGDDVVYSTGPNVEATVHDLVTDINAARL